MIRSTAVHLKLLERQSFIIQAMWITAFTILTAIGAQIEIPHQPVPYTLQTFFVLLSGALLGKRNGALSQILYLLLGSLGVPVFAGFGFGFAKLIGPTGGYLLGFPVAAFVIGYLVGGRSNVLTISLAMFFGLLIIFSLGAIQLNFVYLHNWSEAVAQGLLIFSWWDLAKLFAAVVIAHRFSRLDIGQQ